MTIMLNDVLPIKNLEDFKVHFADLIYSRSNFRFALLEHRSFRVEDGTIIGREGFWKQLLLTRGEQGLNRNKRDVMVTRQFRP